MSKLIFQLKLGGVGWNSFKTQEVEEIKKNIPHKASALKHPDQRKKICRR